MLESRRYLYNVQAHIHYTEVAHPRFQTSRLKEPPLEVKQECFLANVRNVATILLPWLAS